ncbi:hypothetical protein SCANM63S_09832 [Streptomyces canarius]
MTIRYSWWGAEERAKKINQSIELFEEKYPKIKVKTDFQTYQSFWEEVPDAGRRRKSPGRFPKRRHIPWEVRASEEFSSISRHRCRPVI